MLDHSLPGSLGILGFNGLENIVMLFIAMLQSGQILIKPFYASGIDLLQGLQNREHDGIMGRFGHLCMESPVKLIELHDILLRDALADALQNVAQHSQLKF